MKVASEFEELISILDFSRKKYSKNIYQHKLYSMSYPYQTGFAFYDLQNMLLICLLIADYVDLCKTRT